MNDENPGLESPVLLCLLYPGFLAVYPGFLPVYQGLMPVCRGCLSVYPGFMPVYRTIPFLTHWTSTPPSRLPLHLIPTIIYKHWFFVLLFPLVNLLVCSCSDFAKGCRTRASNVVILKRCIKFVKEIWRSAARAALTHDAWIDQWESSSRRKVGHYSSCL